MPVQKLVHGTLVTALGAHAVQGSRVRRRHRVSTADGRNAMWHTPPMRICLRSVLRRPRVHSFLLDPSSPTPRNQYHPLYWYTVHMTSLKVWNRVRTTHALVFQSDTVLCRPLSLPMFAKFSYVGGVSSALQRVDARVPQHRHLNGGLALHDVAVTRRCIRTPHVKRMEEDSVWNVPQKGIDGPGAHGVRRTMGTPCVLTTCRDDAAVRSVCTSRGRRPRTRRSLRSCTRTAPTRDAFVASWEASGAAARVRQSRRAIEPSVGTTARGQDERVRGVYQKTRKLSGVACLLATTPFRGIVEWARRPTQI